MKQPENGCEEHTNFEHHHLRVSGLLLYTCMNSIMDVDGTTALRFFSRSFGPRGHCQVHSSTDDFREWMLLPRHNPWDLKKRRRNTHPRQTPKINQPPLSAWIHMPVHVWGPVCDLCHADPRVFDPRVIPRWDLCERCQKGDGSWRQV